MPKIGKLVVDELYLHISALEYLDDLDQKIDIQRRLTQISLAEGQAPNVIKINQKTGRLSLLDYPSFEDEAFPVLRASWSFQGKETTLPLFRSYSHSLNPPILHRKEMLVGPGFPLRDGWGELTTVAVNLGLFDDTRTIGFKLNWERLIANKGYRFDGVQFQPLGNDPSEGDNPSSEFGERIDRHLTALVRNAMSAPVQLLIRFNLLSAGRSFFDYGCGRGQDVKALLGSGLTANGWDPHYAPNEEIAPADVVNLGFVVNVIEDPAERVEAVRRAFDLTKSVMSVGVMLYGSEVSGRPYLDGYRTSRNTFQKYFTQQEFKDLLEQVLHREAFLVAPGIAFVFADPNMEQQYVADRYRSRNIVSRAHVERTKRPVRRPPALEGGRRTRLERVIATARPLFDALWNRSLQLGRLPEADEVDELAALTELMGSFSKVIRVLTTIYDSSVLEAAARIRSDDLRVFFAMQQFSRRATYRSLESKLQRDIRYHFGDYRRAQSAGLALLQEVNSPGILYECCKAAASDGLGWLEGQASLQLHASLVDRLPAPLRVYVGCGLQLYGNVGDAQLIKIHISSGKLSLLEFQDFDKTPLPPLKIRTKVNIRKLDYEVFEYGGAAYPMPLLYRKSRYLHEDYPGYADQLAFDDAIEATGLIGDSGYGPSAELLVEQLESKRLAISGFQLVRSNRLPTLDERCGLNFTYRDFIECGETQKRSGIANKPKNASSYTALYDLATNVLDPVVDYFGGIRLTYGFSSQELSSEIKVRIAPKLDQHACYEKTRSGRMICNRGGAACDFIVEDEDMREVADWIVENLSFDRLYFYSADRPIHVSYSENNSGSAYEFQSTKAGKQIPRSYRRQILR